MKTLKLTVLAVLGLYAAACTDPGGGPTVLPTPDAAAEVSTDTSIDVTVTPDGTADATPDATPDGTPDAIEDAAADAVSDTPVADAGPDGVSDAISDGEADGVADADGGQEDTVTTPDIPVIPDPTITPDNSLCSAPGGDINIYDIQNPACPDHFDPEPFGNPGEPVALSGVIVTAVYGDTIFVQEPQGGPYSGLAVFMHGLFTGDLNPGDVMNLDGGYSEFFGNTQVYMENYTVTSSGPAPEPYLIDYPHWISTGGPLAEMFEGVLVKVENVETTNTIPDCPQDYGEFMVTGDLRVDDKGYAWDARLGDQFDAIVGPISYDFSNHKMLPRVEADVDWTVKGSDSALTKCIASECQEEESSLGTQEILITEVMVDPFGSDFGQEWFELHNPNSYQVDVEGWEIRDCGDQKLTIPPGNTTIFPGGYMVIGQTIDTALNGGVEVDFQYGPAFYLPNTISSILLYKPGANPNIPTLVDQARLRNYDPYNNIYLGASSERINPAGSGSDASNWAAGSVTYGPTENQGTPGAKNSATP